MSAPSKTSLLHLYSSLLRTSLSFSSYNFRTYFVRRTKETWRDFQTNANVTPEHVANFYNNGLKELAVLRRSALVNSIYGGRKLVVESNQAPKRLRGDT